MGASKFIKSFIASAALAVGAAGLSAPAMAGEADAAARPTLRQDIVNAFNKVSGKVVKISELKRAFGNVAAKYDLGYFERGAAHDFIDEMQKTNAFGLMVGLDANGKMTFYVDASALQSRLVEAIDSGKADGREDSLKRISQAAAEAISMSPDHSGNTALASSSRMDIRTAALKR